MSKKRGIGKFIAGAAVGAGLGLLFAPKSGSETRKELKAKLDDLVNQIKNIDIDEVKAEFEKTLSQSFEKKTFFEVMYENELNRNIQFEFEDIIRNLNGNAQIISWKTKRKEEKKNTEGFDSIDSYEIADLKGEEIFTRLIQIKSKEQDLDYEECIKEYLPRFMKIMSEEENENS